MPKEVFFSELQEGKCDRSAPRKRYKDRLKRQLAQAGISHQPWQQEASDQHSWFSSVRKASCAVGGAHQESVSTATNEHAGNDHQPSQQSSSARNESSHHFNSKQVGLRHVSRSSGLVNTISQGTVKWGRRQGRQKEVGRLHQGMDRPGVRQVRKGSGGIEKWRTLVLKSSVVP